MRGRNRPAAEKQRAVSLALMTSGSEAARQTGIPERTIQQWVASPEFAELRDRKKELVEPEWWAGIQAYQRSIMADLETASLRDKVGAFAILFEKWSLLRGDATARTETKDISGDIPDHIKRELRSRFADSVRDQSEAVAPEGETEPTTT